MAEFIDREKMISIIEERQKALFPVGMYGRCFIYGTEREILKWASAHPEVTYPTWEEWLAETFPKIEFAETTFNISPCNFVKQSEWEIEADVRCVAETCASCRKKPIPASIAEKLGVKLKEVR